MTSGERLVSLAGSGQAGVLLLSIGQGSTAGAALVNYSGLPSATAAVHLLTDVIRTSNQGAGSGRYKDHEIWLYIESLKKAHKKEFVKPEPRVERSYTTDLYTPEVEKLILEIKTARAVSRPKTHILGLVKELDFALKAIQDEEDEVIELFLLN